MIAELLDSDAFRNCMVAVMDRGMSDALMAGAGDDPSLVVDVEVVPMRPSVALEPGGASMAFGIDLQIGELRMPMVMETHSWARSNVEVTVIVLGDGRDLDVALIADLVGVVDHRLVEALS